MKSNQITRRKFLNLAGGSAVFGSALPLFLHTDRVSAQFGAPVFTIAERDRRWNNIRAFMSREGLDCLIIPHQTGDSHLAYAGYVSNHRFALAPGAVIFPVNIMLFCEKFNL